MKATIKTVIPNTPPWTTSCLAYRISSYKANIFCGFWHDFQQFARLTTSYRAANRDFILVPLGLVTSGAKS
jgi:hypothetical protein